MISSDISRTDIFSLYGKLKENEKDDHKMISMSLHDEANAC